MTAQTQPPLQAAPKSPIARYIVLQHDGAWRINLNNLYYGPYEDRDAAVTTAARTAREASLTGHRAQVLLATDRGMFRLLWDSADAVEAEGGE